MVALTSFSRKVCRNLAATIIDFSGTPMGSQECGAALGRRRGLQPCSTPGREKLRLAG